MRVILDLETTSLSDLREVGVHVYAADPSTRVTCAGYAIDNDPVAVWRPGAPAPAAFVAACGAGAVIVAHNYAFDFTCYRRLLVPLGWPPVPLSRWSCTMARSLVAGFPASLEAAGEAIGLGHRKDTTAHGLMLRFARPRSLNPLVWWHETDPKRYDRLCEYCARDVAAQRELDQVLPELSPRERKLFELDFRINERGLGVDRALVRDLANLAREAHAGLQHDILTLTAGSVQTTNQVARLRAWLEAHGCDIPNLRRDTIKAWLDREDLDKTVRAVLQTRVDASRSSVAKLAKITASSGIDGRVRGTLQYYGANRTGRWAGRRIQPQNLYRGSIDDVPGAIASIRAGTPVAELEKTHKESALGIVASCLRSAIVAAPGYRLVIADFAQIEARVLAWLAGQLDALEVFRSGEDIYTHTAARIGSSSRQLGKVVVLACIAEGEPVLTDQGLIPIEDVTKDMRVWDGIEWVSHDGVVCRGERETIDYDGLRATPDHLVWTTGSDDPVPLGAAASQVARLVRAGAGRTPLWVMGSGRPNIRPQQWLPSGTLSMFGLQDREAGRLAKPEQRQYPWLSLSISAECEPLSRTVDVQSQPPHDCGKTTLSEPERSRLEVVRQPRDYLRFSDSTGRGRLGYCEPRCSVGFSTDDRQNRQQQGVQPRQLTLGDVQRADAQHAQVSQVYDIVNSGPRHRFTVSGRLVHNCGFGMGAAKFRDTAAGYKVDLDEETATEVVRAWRHANPEIVNYWYDAHNALIRAMRNPGSYERCRGTVFQRRQKMLLARLPSGRHLVYRYPRLDEVPGFGPYPRLEFSYMGNIGSTWTRLRAWPGKIVENLTQAVARDVMADAMLGLASTPLVATVHDELIAEVPEGDAEATLGSMLGAMRASPAWASSMPVDAAGVISQHYVKA